MSLKLLGLVKSSWLIFEKKPIQFFRDILNSGLSYLITTATKNFVMLQAGGKASKYGSYKCDSPKILVESAFKAMKNLVPDPEFILWTGDSDPKSIIPFRNSTFSIFQHQYVLKSF